MLFASVLWKEVALCCAALVSSLLGGPSWSNVGCRSNVCDTDDRLLIN